MFCFRIGTSQGWKIFKPHPQNCFVGVACWYLWCFQNFQGGSPYFLYGSSSPHPRPLGLLLHAFCRISNQQILWQEILVSGFGLTTVRSVTHSAFIRGNANYSSGVGRYDKLFYLQRKVCSTILGGKTHRINNLQVN